MLKNIELEIERIQYEYQGIKGMGFDSCGGGGTNEISRSVENEVLQKEKTLNRLDAQRRNLVIEIRQIDNAMGRI